MASRREVTAAVAVRYQGSGRSEKLEGLGAAAALATLHDVVRLYVNYFQPCFKLKSKTREGAKVIKKYHAPATPAERLLASDRVSPDGKQHIRDVFASLDPVELLRRIRQSQRQLASLEVMSQAAPPLGAQPETGAFVASLSVAWQDGEIRPTHRKQTRGPRTWRTRADDFQEVWPMVERWLRDEPDTSAKELFMRLQELMPDQLQRGQLRTLQRRVKAWRSEMVRQLVFGASSQGATQTSDSMMAL